MIWNASSFASNLDLETLATHIAGEIRSSGPENPECLETPDGNELARSVAEFVFQHVPDFAKPASSPGRSARPEREASDGLLIPSDYLLIMTCRALWAVGHEQAARALLRTKGPELNIAESYAPAVFGKGLFPGLGMHAALVRALRPSSSLWNMSGPYWILNLRTVFSFLDTGLELTIWRIMHALIKQLGLLWDISGGKGTLGLSNSHYVSAHLLGFPRKSSQGRRFTAELISYCEQDLMLAAEERKWQSVPMVMNVGA